MERKIDPVTIAFEFQVSSEVVDDPRRSCALWVAGQLPMHAAIKGPWSLTLRPEVAWDRDGRWTMFEQFVRALTTTLEYRARAGRSQAILRLEHRYNNSSGNGGGFVKEIQPGVLGLNPGQHLLVLGWNLT